MTLCVGLLGACAGNSPRKPAEAEAKNSASDYDDCRVAETRGAPPPVGCPQTSQNRRASRPVPGVQHEPMTLPNLPGPGSIGSVLGR